MLRNPLRGAKRLVAVTAFLTTILIITDNQAGITQFNQSIQLVRDNTSKPIEYITSETVKPVIQKLSTDEYEGRGAGYEGERKAAEFVANEFKSIGLAPAGDMTPSVRSYFQVFKFHPHHPVVPWEMLTSRNVIGFLAGTDPALKDEIVVIGAHYDGQGKLGQADPFRRLPTDAAEKDLSIWHSANDNLTGVSAVLAAARAMRNGGVHTRRSILFIAFGCEEHGMSGSIEYVSHPAFPLQRHVAMINFEKLGRAADKPLIAGSVGTSPTWNEILSGATAATGTPVKSPVPFVIPDSDHYPFVEAGIPAIIFSVSGADEAHLPTDVANKIDFAKVAEYARFGFSVLLDLANRPAKPMFADIRGLDPGMIAHLASDEECDAAGLISPNAGLKVTGVILGRAADRAGVRAGDLLLKCGELSFQRNMTLSSLQKMQMQMLTGQLGTDLPVTILRSGKEFQTTIHLVTK